MARLSQYQRNMLDGIIENLIDTLVKNYKDGFTNDELLSLVMDNNNNNVLPDDTNVRNIIPAIDRIFNGYNAGYRREADGKIYRTVNRDKKYILEAYKCFEGSNIVKDKNLLTFVNHYNENDNLVYDFSQHKFIDNNPSNYRFLDWESRNFFNGLSNILKELYSYEWIFNYINDFSELVEFFTYARREDATEEIKTCPKGFIKYLNETNERFSYEALQNFKLVSKYGVYGVNILKSLFDGYSMNRAISCLDWLIKENLVSPLSKMLNYSLKAGYIPSRSETNDLIDYIRDLKESNIEFSIDINKTVKQNIELAKIARDKQKNEALARQLQKLNFINGFTDNEYIVVVPQNQDEKKNEGEQQHNCVGYYYDDSILRGENFIFFIRKANNPTKSYITCRYNTRHKKVVEYRGFANGSVTDKKTITFLQQVEAIIKEHNAEL